MPFTVKASFRGKTRVVSFDQGSGFPPHAIINAKVSPDLELQPFDAHETFRNEKSSCGQCLTCHLVIWDGGMSTFLLVKAFLKQSFGG